MSGLLLLLQEQRLFAAYTLACVGIVVTWASGHNYSFPGAQWESGLEIPTQPPCHPA